MFGDDFFLSLSLLSIAAMLDMLSGGSLEAKIKNKN